jgi:polar amino acid transport system substrate-binding protein
MRRPTNRLRWLAAALAASSLALAACGSDSKSSDSSAATGTNAAGTGAAGAPQNCDKTIEAGTLTLATGQPAFEPWVVDDKPESGKGFEAAVGLAVAKQMGYEGDKVKWVRTTFDEAIQPGAKNFDLNLQQFSITPDRAENIDFSLPYYSSNQAIVALNGSKAAGAKSIADLKDVKFGAQAGTTSLDFIKNVIKPTQDVFIYDDNAGAKAALQANQIDAAVFDLATALYVSGAEIEGSSVIGQIVPPSGTPTDQLGFVLTKGNPLKSCVDAAITTLTDSGELKKLADTWLSDQVAPIIKN